MSDKKVASEHSSRSEHDRTTRRLLTAGAAAGVVYTVVGGGQIIGREGVDVGREGVDVTRHALSLLSNGEFGWIQITNFVVTGLLLVAGSVGMQRAFQAASTSRGGAAGAGRLLAGYGATLIAAGIFRADPALGFPPGTPEGPGPISWHGVAHFGVGAVGFICFIVSCFVLARRFSRQDERGWAIWGRITGLLFLAAFIGIASGSAGPTTLAFVLSVLLSWVWLTSVFLKVRATRKDN